MKDNFPLSRYTRRIGTFLADALWPRTCIVCGGSDNLDQYLVCDQCWRKLDTAPPVEKPKPIDRLVIGFAYDDTLRPIIHRFKFDQTPGLAKPLASRLLDRLETMGFVFYDSILVPVPAHPARNRERGYNPAAELTQEMSKRLGLPFHPNYATRRHHSPHQSSLPDDARKRTLKQTFSFAARPAELPETTRLVLVDDVIHTARTMGQLARTARKAGWKKIDAVCLSR